MEYDVNANLIFEKERELARILDWELRENLKNYKKFEFLENEKLTPHFMNIVKKSRPDASVEEIKTKRVGFFLHLKSAAKILLSFTGNYTKNPENKTIINQ
jgi:hypothetical protein